MKRIIIIIFLFFNILPVIEHKKLSFAGPTATYAEEGFGDECSVSTDDAEEDEGYSDEGLSEDTPEEDDLWSEDEAEQEDDGWYDESTADSGTDSFDWWDNYDQGGNEELMDMQGDPGTDPMPADMYNSPRGNVSYGPTIPESITSEDLLNLMRYLETLYLMENEGRADNLGGYRINKPRTDLRDTLNENLGLYSLRQGDYGEFGNGEEKEECKNVNKGGEKDGGLTAGALVLGGATSETGVGLVIIGGVVLYEYGPMMLKKMNEGVDYVVNKVQGFGDPKKWTTSHRPSSQDPVNNPPNGFNPKNFPPNWNGAVKWGGIGYLGYKFYKSINEPFINKPVAPRDNTTVIRPYNP